MTRADSRRPDQFTQVEQELRTWSAAHPRASLTEIEQAVERQLRRVRADLVTELAGAVTPAEVCPDCGQPLRSAGAHTRTVITEGEEPLVLTRTYATCSACGAGLFPPG